MRAGDAGQVARQPKQALARQPGKGRRLHLLRRQAAPGGGGDGDAGQQRAQAVEQVSVQGAAAANQQLLRRATEGACGIGAGCGGEFGQGCLHVLAPRTGKALQMRIQPGAMEQRASQDKASFDS